MIEGNEKTRKSVQMTSDARLNENLRGVFYYCPYSGCNKAFAKKGNMKTHVRIHVSCKFKKCI